jgi:hypothetical protein
MVSACEPLLDGCDSNHAVEDLLRKEGVLTKGCAGDSESCQMFIYFKNKPNGNRFIDRLNRWLRERSLRLEMLKEEGFNV